MIAVLQRVSQASVSINDTVAAKIGSGLVILLGIADGDADEDIQWLVQKIGHMRIFGDEDGKMNLSIRDVNGEFLIVSQFTLHAATKKGNRPSFIKAARPEVAVPLYERFIEEISQFGLPIRTGEFGADMQVALINDGPVTIIVDSKNRV